MIVCSVKSVLDLLKGDLVVDGQIWKKVCTFAPSAASEC